MLNAVHHKTSRWRTLWTSTYIFLLILKPTVSELEISTELSIVSMASSTSVGRPPRAPLQPEEPPASPAPLATLGPLPGADLALDPGSGDGELLLDGDPKNETREALSEESTSHDQVVFLSDSSSYVAVPPLRSRERERERERERAGQGEGGEQEAASHGLEWRLPTDSWDREYRRFRYNTTRVQHIEAECQDEYMKIRVGFNGSFAGLVYSAGYAYDPECMYINGSGRDYYEFYIQLNRCGTLGKNTRHEDPRKTPSKNFMWNTVTVQYNPLIEEEYDEHFKVTCEYGYDFWKTVTFPFLDVEVATGNPVVFTLQPPECYMEIRTGYGTAGPRVAGPVRVGDPLTLIIYMRSKYDGFDIVVNDCYAHNGGTKKIQLIDEFGCPVDDKLISRFRGSWSESGVFETQVFAYLKTFRFTGSPALYIECDVRMCHGRCPTQPCHWRNVKSVRKRAIESNALEGVEGGAAVEGAALEGGVEGGVTPALSENINLFQSLRVLQEGEDEEDYVRNNTRTTPDPNQTCMRSSMFTTIVATGCVVLALLGGALAAAWRRLRRATAFSGGEEMFESYVQHKGRIK